MLEEFTLMTDLLPCSVTRLLGKIIDGNGRIIIRGFSCSVSNASIDSEGKEYEHLQLWKCMSPHIWLKKECALFSLQDKFTLCFKYF